MSKPTQTVLTAQDRIAILTLAIQTADETYSNELAAVQTNAKKGELFIAPRDNRLSLTIRAARKYAAFVENAPKEADEAEEAPAATKKA